MTPKHDDVTMRNALWGRRGVEEQENVINMTNVPWKPQLNIIVTFC